MIFLNGQTNKDKNNSNDSNHNSNNLNQQNTQHKQSNQKRNQKQSHAKKEKETLSETIAKVLAAIGAIVLLAGIGLLVFGIIKNVLYGIIVGGVLIALGIISYIVMTILLCKPEPVAKSKKTNKINTNVSNNLENHNHQYDSTYEA